MTSITPDEGRDWVEARIRGDSTFSSWEMHQVGVGTGTTSVSSTDTQLDSETYRGNRTNSNISVSDGGTGVVTVKISVSGGTEVPAGTTIAELAIWATDPNDNPPTGQNATTEDSKDRMLNREVRSGVTLESGDRKTFEIPYNINSE